MLKLVLDNRSIISVRLIPYVTGWKYTPDVIASILANEDEIHRVLIPSYHFDAKDGYHLMLAKEWDNVVADLDVLSNKLKATETIDNENYPVWRRESIKILPAATFVWVDELETAWHTDYSEARRIMLDEKPGDRDLNLSPLIPSNITDLIYEGFEPHIVAIYSGTNPDNQETPDQRKQRLETLFQEEQDQRGERGALKRTAEREGITRQTLTEILNRKK